MKEEKKTGNRSGLETGQDWRQVRARDRSGLETGQDEGQVRTGNRSGLETGQSNSLLFLSLSNVLNY